MSPSDRDPDGLAGFATQYPRWLVITGAGCSAPSGIPTYRDATGRWLRSAPITHQDFLTQERFRQRYWARSFAGWPLIHNAQPNGTHQHLVRLERAGLVRELVTQNVDGLHQKAGHKQVVDLHGRLAEVICLTCGAISSRQAMQDRLQRLNPALNPLVRGSAAAPDGDAEVQDQSINIPPCRRCGGILKPHVVFYGGVVDRSIVQHIRSTLEGVDALLVVGSSLMVFSAFRFCRYAAEIGKPIAIVNRGMTRADSMVSLKLDADCETALAGLVRFLNLGNIDEPPTSPGTGRS